MSIGSEVRSASDRTLAKKTSRGSPLVFSVLQGKPQMQGAPRQTSRRAPKRKKKREKFGKGLDGAGSKEARRERRWAG
ncbi:hypothetical protein [Pandoravirus japonicus]|uniref:Uncharacterized protein n=1 Tax=Pandoravirus japonicus TaxID=2823154 RepID=A0A811BRS3_9VIRU|nr:hypothetical protein [Pandoravirus japonicus]